MIGLGCDVCAISRMRESMGRERFLQRFFTAHEQAHIAARKARPEETAAGIFAAKEAFVKALGTGFSGIGPADVAVGHDGQGAPFYEINGKMRAALEEKGAKTAFLSISHDGDTAFAVAVIE